MYRIAVAKCKIFRKFQTGKLQFDVGIMVGKAWFFTFEQIEDYLEIWIIMDYEIHLNYIKCVAHCEHELS